MLDRFGRTINYLRISVTDRCNFKCSYCIPPEGIGLLPQEILLSYEEILAVVKTAIKSGINRFRITGGEPLLRPGIIGFIDKLINTAGVDAVSLTTNGYLLNRHHKDLARLGLASINVSLNSLDAQRFKTITGIDGLAEVWQGITQLANSTSPQIKINTVLLKGLNENELIDFAKLTLRYPIILRYIEFMPCGQWDQQADSIIKAQEVMERLSAELGKLIPYQDKSLGKGPAQYYRLETDTPSRGIIGFIAPVTHVFCQSCNRLRLTPGGHLKSCLLSQESTDIKPILRNDINEPARLNALTDALKQAILDKPLSHNAQRNNVMSQIGG